MLSLEILKSIHDDREREIRRALRIRELLHRDPEPSILAPDPCAEARPRSRRQEVAGAAS